MREPARTQEDAADSTAQPALPRGLTDPIAGYLLGVQRSSGNRAAAHVARRLAGRIARSPQDDTGALHEAVYGDSELAHTSPGYDPNKDPRVRKHAVEGVHFLQRNRDGLEFDWSVYPPETVPLMDWLSFYGFGPRRPPDPAGEGCVFNMWKGSTVTAVVKAFVEEAALAKQRVDPEFVRSEVTKALRWREGFPSGDEYEQARHGGLTGPAHQGPLRPPALKPLPSIGGPQITMGLQFNLTRHVDLDTGKGSADPPSVQLTGQVAIPFHRDDEPGWELSAQANVSFGLQVEAGRASIVGIPRVDESSVRVTGVTSAQGAGQAAWVVPLIRETLQLQVFAQVVGGVNWNQVPAQQSRIGGNDAVLKLRRDPAAQLAGGVQAVYTVPGTNKHLQFFAGVQGSGTTSAQGQTADAQLSLGVQWAP